MQQETQLKPNQVKIKYMVNPSNSSEPDPNTYTFKNKEKWTFQPVYPQPFNGMNVFICTYNDNTIPKTQMDDLMESMRSMGINGGRRRTKRSSKRRRTNKKRSSKRRRTLRRRH